MDYLISEFKRGKRIYIGETISLLAVVLFFIGLPKMTFFMENNIGGMILMGWFGVNALVMLVYTLDDFVSMMLGNQKVDKGIAQIMLFKVLFFSLFFGVNMFLLVIGNSIAVPILALMGTFLLLASTKEYFNEKVPYLCLGILWYVTFYLFAYISYKMLYLFLYSIIANVTFVGTLLTIVFFALSFFIFVIVLKKIN